MFHPRVRPKDEPKLGFFIGQAYGKHGLTKLLAYLENRQEPGKCYVEEAD